MSDPKHLLHLVVEEVCSSWPPLTTSSPSKFLQGTFDDKTHGELAAEPVPDLRKALNLREDEIVVLTKACYGSIDGGSHLSGIRNSWVGAVVDMNHV